MECFFVFLFLFLFLFFFLIRGGLGALFECLMDLVQTFIGLILVLSTLYRQGPSNNEACELDGKLKVLS